MEALLLCLDVFVLIAVFVWAIKNSDADSATAGLFRFKKHVSLQAPPKPQIVRRWRTLR